MLILTVHKPTSFQIDFNNPKADYDNLQTKFDNSKTDCGNPKQSSTRFSHNLLKGPLMFHEYAMLTCMGSMGEFSDRSNAALIILAADASASKTL